MILSFNLYADDKPINLDKPSLNKTYYGVVEPEGMGEFTTTNKMARTFKLYSMGIYQQGSDNKQMFITGSQACAKHVLEVNSSNFIGSAACLDFLTYLTNVFSKDFLAKLYCDKKTGCSISNFNPATYSGLKASNISCSASMRSQEITCLYKGGARAALRDMVRLAIVKHEKKTKTSENEELVTVSYGLKFIVENLEIPLPATVKLGYVGGTDAGTPYWEEANTGFQIFTQRYVDGQYTRTSVCKDAVGSCIASIDVTKCNKKGVIDTNKGTNLCVRLGNNTFADDTEFFLITDSDTDKEEVKKVGQYLMKAAASAANPNVTK